MTVNEVFSQLMEAPVRSLVISGGEPMLQQRRLAVLIEMLLDNGWHVEIETAGTIKPLDMNMVSLFTVSLKLAHSGNAESLRLNHEAIGAFAACHHAVFKFVAGSVDDFAEIDHLVQEFFLRRDHIFIMPEGIKADRVQEVTAQIADATIKRGYHLTTRLQILTYGNKRAV